MSWIQRIYKRALSFIERHEEKRQVVSGPLFSTLNARAWLLEVKHLRGALTPTPQPPLRTLTGRKALPGPVKITVAHTYAYLRYPGLTTSPLFYTPGVSNIVITYIIIFYRASKVVERDVEIMLCKVEAQK